MDSKQQSNLFEAAKALRHTSLPTIITGALSAAIVLIVGIFILIHSEGDLLEIGGAAMVLVGVLHAVAMSAFNNTFILKRKATPSVSEISDPITLAGILSRASVRLHFATVRDPLLMHAYVFYAGLIAGLLGICVAVYGIVDNLYASTLAGSIVTAMGFVTLACALVSAEDVGEDATAGLANASIGFGSSESREDGRLR